MKRFLFDTDILIEYLRGKIEARDYIDAIKGQLYISVITVAELYSGVRQDDEFQKLETFVESFQVISLNHKIAKLGGNFRNRYHPAYGTGLADALIAASAQEIGAQLVTFNTKHFPMFSDIVVPYERV